MKTHLHLALCSLILVLIPSAFSQTTSVKQVYQEGLAAYQAENWAVAVEKFSRVYRATRNPKVQYYLRNAQLKLSQGEPSVSLETKLKQVVIPNIEFEDTDIPTALEYLRGKTAELTQKKIQPNFIYKADPDALNPPVFTLQLSNIPVSEVIRYIGEMTRTKFRYEAHAVIGYPSHMVVPSADQ